jgi:hypothetical protein
LRRYALEGGLLGAVEFADELTRAEPVFWDEWAIPGRSPSSTSPDAADFN